MAKASSLVWLWLWGKNSLNSWLSVTSSKALQSIHSWDVPCAVLRWQPAGSTAEMVWPDWLWRMTLTDWRLRGQQVLCLRQKNCCLKGGLWLRTMACLWISWLCPMVASWLECACTSWRSKARLMMVPCLKAWGTSMWAMVRSWCPWRPKGCCLQQVPQRMGMRMRRKQPSRFFGGWWEPHKHCLGHVQGQDWLHLCPEQGATEDLEAGGDEGCHCCLQPPAFVWQWGAEGAGAWRLEEIEAVGEAIACFAKWKRCERLAALLVHEDGNGESPCPALAVLQICRASWSALVSLFYKQLWAIFWVGERVPSNGFQWGLVTVTWLWTLLAMSMPILLSRSLPWCFCPLALWASSLQRRWPKPAVFCRWVLWSSQRKHWLCRPASVTSRKALATLLHFSGSKKLVKMMKAICRRALWSMRSWPFLASETKLHWPRAKGCCWKPLSPRRRPKSRKSSWHLSLLFTNIRPLPKQSWKKLWVLC